jgi:hypothetical protein
MHRTQHAREQIEQYVQEKDINEKETASGLESKTHNTSRGCRTCVVFYNALKLQISSAVTTQSINGITTPTTLPGAHIGSHRRCGEAIFGCWIESRSSVTSRAPLFRLKTQKPKTNWGCTSLPGRPGREAKYGFWGTHTIARKNV